MSNVINISDYMDKLKDPAIDADLDTDILKPDLKRKKFGDRTFGALEYDAVQKLKANPEIFSSLAIDATQDIFRRCEYAAEKLGIHPSMLGYVMLGLFPMSDPQQKIQALVAKDLHDDGLID